MLADSRHLRLCHDSAVRDGLEVELIGPPVLLDRLSNEFPTLSRELVDHCDATVLTADEPPFALLFPDPDVGKSDPECAILVTYDDDDPCGCLVIEDEAGVNWAHEYYESVRAEAHDATQEFVVEEGHPRVPGLGRRRLPAQLRSEGFVRVDETLFDRREPMAPTTAWQAGVGLPEVAAGYTVDRYRTLTDTGAEADPTVGDTGPDSTDGAPSGGEVHAECGTITDEILAALYGGEQIALLGPPGSGKSTVAKRVAYRWAEESGRVLYRESGRGQPLTATGLLHEVLETGTEPILVVVEDAVRAEANAVFEVMERFAGSDSVSFLVDARESEWTSPEDFPNDARLRAHQQTAVDSRRIPALDAEECERLIDEVATILDEPLDVDVDSILAELCEESSDSRGLPPGSMFLLFSRLGRIIDPFSVVEDEKPPTTLDADIDQLCADLRSIGDTAVDVGVLLNLLNAAEREVRPEYALTLAWHDAPDELIRREQQTIIRSALDRLDGHVLFDDDGGDEQYRTVHSRWSIRFLERLLETDERTAEQRFGRCVTALLSLADHPSIRADVLSEHSTVDHSSTELTENPGLWGRRTCLAFFRVGVEFAQLAPLYGTSGNTTIRFPEACSANTRLQCVAKRARMLQRNGRLETAVREYELIEADIESRPNAVCRRLLAECHHWHADILRIQGELDAAREHCQAGSELARELGEPRLEALCQLTLGVVRSDGMDYTEALEDYRQSLAIARELGDVRLEARALLMAAQTRYKPGIEDLEGAIRQLERALEAYRTVGSPEGVAVTLGQLGRLKNRRPEYDSQAALTDLHTALELTRQTGQQRVEAWTLADLGYVWHTDREFETAIEYYERSIEMASETGQLVLSNEAHCELGQLFAFSGRLDRAMEHLDADLDRISELEHWDQLLWHRRDAALVQLIGTRPDEAIETVQEALAIARERQIVPYYELFYWLGRAQCLSGALDGTDRTVARLRDREPWIDPTGSWLEAQQRYFRGDFEAAVSAARTSVSTRAVDVLGPAWPIVLARVALELDELDAAETSLDRVIEYERTPQYRYWSQLALVDRGRIHRRRGDEQAATDDLQTAHQDAQECGFSLPEARARLQQAGLARDRGDYDAAITQLGEVLTVLDELGAPFYAGRARYERGLCKYDQEKWVDARDSLTTAVEQFQEIGADYETARTSRVLADVCERLGDESAARRHRTRGVRLDPTVELSSNQLLPPDSWPLPPS
jgi:tetratricopeptide (TPR) repeat protein/energy-coupling factor transporter ATP-binding protein EcfA2